MADQKKEEEEDVRLQFINSWTTRSLRLKADKWPKMLTNHDFMNIVNEFFGKPELATLVLNVREGGLLVPYLGFPTTTKTKSVYFTKTVPEPVTDENYKQVLVFGDIPPYPLDALSVLLEEIVSPILSHPKNRETWPKCVGDDVLRHANNFRETVLEVRGKVLGHTLLPMPVGVEMVAEHAAMAVETRGKCVDLQFKSAIEGSVIKWVHLIDEVIRDDVVKPMPGVHPGPLAEIEFWNKRRNNLENLYEQMCDTRIQKMAMILEVTNSAYYSSYNAFFAKVVAGVAEAKEVTAYIRPFTRYVTNFETCEFTSSERELEAIMHCICIMYSRSSYYSQSQRILGFLKMFSNSVVNQCIKFLDSGSVFQGDPEESRLRIAQSLDVLMKFWQMVTGYRTRLDDYFLEQTKEPKNWNFHLKVAFDRVLRLIDRLKIIKDLLDTVIDLMKLERIIFGGIAGRALGMKVQAVMDDFLREWGVFSSINYDPLDPDCALFLDDYKVFQRHADDFDRRLSAIFAQALDECFDAEGIFKGIVMLGSLASRRLIRSDVEDRYLRGINLMEVDLDSVKLEFDAGLSTSAAPLYFPPTSAIISWIAMLRSRVTVPFKLIKFVQAIFPCSYDLSPVNAKQDEMLELLATMEENSIAKFYNEAPIQAELLLNQPLIKRIDGPDTVLDVNFDPGLVAILKELRYLNSLGEWSLPRALTELRDRDDELFVWAQSLNYLVTCYNHIKLRSRPVELALIENQLQLIDDLLNTGISLFNWTSSDAAAFISSTRLLIKRLHARFVKSQANLERIYELMFQWRDKPIYVRGTGNLLSLHDRNTKLASRYQAITDAGKKVHELLKLNYHLLLNIPLPEDEGDECGDFEGEGGSEEEEDEGFDGAEADEDDDIDLMINVKPVEEKEVAVEEPEPVESKVPVLEKSRKPEKRKKPKRKGTKAKKKKKAEPVEQVVVEKKDEVELGKGEPAIDVEAKWQDYVEHVDQLVIGGILSAVASSLGYLLDETDENRGLDPLMRIALELLETDLNFVPSLDDDSPNGFHNIILMIMDDIVGVGSLVTRVAQNKSSDYSVEANGCVDLARMRMELIGRASRVVQQARDIGDELMQYAKLWQADKAVALAQFLLFSRTLTQEEEELTAMGILVIPEKKPTMEDFKKIIDYYLDLHDELDEKVEEKRVLSSWLWLDCRPFKLALLNTVNNWGWLYKNHLYEHVLQSISELEEMISVSEVVLAEPVADGDYDTLVRVMHVLYDIRERTTEIDDMFEPLWHTIDLLKTCDVEMPESAHIALQELPGKWSNLKKMAVAVRQQIQPLIVAQVTLIKKRIALFDIRQSNYRDHFGRLPIFKPGCKDIYSILDGVHVSLLELERVQSDIAEQAALFEVPITDVKYLTDTRKDLKLVKALWDLINISNSWVELWKTSPWKKLDVEGMEQELKRFAKELRGLDKDCRVWNAYVQAEADVRNMMTSLRAVTELQNPAIRDRHWQELMDATKICYDHPHLTVKFMMNAETTLADLLMLNLHEYEEEVNTIVDKAVKEMTMEKTLDELEHNWKQMEFDRVQHSRTRSTVIAASEELIELLENDQNQLQNMMSSKFIDHFAVEVSSWQVKLSQADAVTTLWLEVQRAWQHLESIFIGSEDIRSQLPADTSRFEAIDKRFRGLLSVMIRDVNVIRATNKQGLAESLEQLQQQLTLCEKALADYLETKRLVYPRFYFVSSSDLLDILSTGNQPELVARHLTKLYDSLGKLKFLPGSKNACGMFAKDGEYVKFKTVCDCSGKVEVWLNRVTETMRKTLRAYLAEAVLAYDDKPRDQFLMDFPAQVALCATQISWNTEVTQAFQRLGEGYENALKEYNKKQVQQLSVLIAMLLGELSRGDRQKIMTICTIDVHSRDVIGKIVALRVDSVTAFEWQSQLRHRWHVKLSDCFANICDAQFRYDYEYLGCTPRLVITPLTDRCYITLTQSLHLMMGGAPAGPAGTGKTETTKDLGRALGFMVYVFNCSEQMDYKSCGSIYKGLAQTGAWGCFDEFNRISVEVLSVIAVQVKSVQDAIKAGKQNFVFMGETISLVPTVGIFITMNPGYAGRTELPENLKALFRPCAMVVPDFELICEIMLVAEGFQEARLLARKFITLYTLCRELLSKQDHYDWGLRAIKSVLVVAGSLKRDDRDRAEEQVLMRALRDFNVPKIVTDDVPVFMGLIGDLFPALDVPRKRNLDLERDVRAACIDLKLQPEENFILKCVQLEELFEVRHSVFIVGFAGTGKTQVWKTLMRTYAMQKLRPCYSDLNPKAVTNDELFGAINPATREWRDGLFSVLMREQANMTGDGPKWIVLDGDIDPMWIESLNTLMDDNKVLTLASNERIALTPSMRLLFEISNLRTATPATVSRAGILYINPADLGWNPFITSWIETRKNESEKVQLIILFDKYVPSCLEAIKLKMKKITPLPDINHVQILCHLLNCLLVPANIPDDCPKEWYEMYFVFACVWAFGAAMFQDQLIDWRNEFSKWFQAEFKTVRFPSGGNVFSYYIHPETKQLTSWSELVPHFEFDEDVPLQSALVSTTETTRLRYLMDMLMGVRVPVMLVGGAGSGKSVIVGDKIASLSDSYIVTNVPFNFYTTSEMLQKVLEKRLEKKAGRNFGPPGSKTMIYFIDDMNMPKVDLYGTVEPHTLIRQHIDYSHWYDRTKLTLKEIHNCQYVSCMNPTAGSFTIDARLQRHFAVFAVSLPSVEAIQSIYEKIFTGHLKHSSGRYSETVVRSVSNVVTVAIALHQRVMQAFLPTAIKFHYTFNMRDLANIFQGMLFCSPDSVPHVNALVKLWVHEASRVYSDKLIEEKDLKTFNGIIKEIVTKGFEEVDEKEVFTEPLVFSHFAEGIGENRYMPINSWSAVSHLLHEALLQYNDLVAAADLVLFEDAMLHVCRINRILESPRGNALLIGVGGSGKQSLSRLAAFISSLQVFQLQLRKGYSLIDLKADLAAQYLKAGLKNVGVVFLMTDAQVAQEQFLVVVNDCLASGEVAEMFADDEVDNIVASVRNEVKSAGIADTKENCWKYMIDKVRRQLKIVLCFSPVGSVLRIRARKFPAIVNCTAIDWFHEWPHDALVSVSQRFLKAIPSLPEELYEPVSRFMAHVHTTVNLVSQSYFINERRYNYTTPKSFLEQISLYAKLLDAKTAANLKQIEKFESGMTKLVTTSEQVDGLKETLKDQEVILSEKNAEADKLILVVRTESELVAKEKAIAAEEEEKVRIISADVAIKQKMCEEDLAKAEPALIAAQAALDTLDKTNLTEYKSLGTPPPGADDVAAAVMVLFAVKGKIPRLQDRSWKNSKAMMGKVDTFLDQLKTYDKDNISPEAVKAVQYYLDKPDFDPEKIKTKSSAAAGLCSWVINIIKYYDVFKEVEPKRLALAKANRELEDATNKLSYLNDKLAELKEKLDKLTDEYNVALEAKQKCQDEADATALQINLANRLINGLASESVRWKQSVAMLKTIVSNLPGDILLSSAFISYLGCFTRRYRIDLIENHWRPFLKTQAEPPIPMTDGADHVNILTDDAQIAAWNNEGLPGDGMSIENATILVNCSRWPLMIDPQLQGIKWIKSKYGEDLKILRLGQKNYLEIIEKAISDGDTILIENIEESVDAVLEPLLSRALIRKGTAIKIGDKEVDFNPQFRLILHTKLANPHYKPEMQAQTTLINFTVTKDGLEEQLLGLVVKAERPDLEQLKTELTLQQNSFKINLKTLEEDLLSRLNSAGDDICRDVVLVNNLETAAVTSAEIKVKAAEARVTAVKIDEAREQYRAVAARASLLYFVLNDLNSINPIYQFSLKAFSVVFNKAIAETEAEGNIRTRVLKLVENVTYCVFVYTSRALFEKDKIIFTAHMAIQILIAAKEIEPDELDFILRYPVNVNVLSPLDFLPPLNWAGIKALSAMSEFKNLDKDIEASVKRWRKVVESEKPEREHLPQDWKTKSPLQRLCILRCLRPDRVTYGITALIEDKLGNKFAESPNVNLQQSYAETSATTPVLLILSPGVDPSKDVERLARQVGVTLHNVSLGQGQEPVAEEAMDVASREGQWVMLQNVHLVKNWLATLEKKMEQCMEGADDRYRLFITAEPAPTRELHILPQGILESAIKITNEPPAGMMANIHKALDNFDQATLESCTKETEFKAVLFSLCYFHAVIAERRKFGAQGWNKVYPFNNGDLRISANVLFNYLESNNRVPWEHLRYLFGEIMYGGHITDDWDRKLCKTYLEEYMRPDLVDGELMFAPGFSAPPNLDYVGYHRYVDEALPAESPILYGLHLNAEIGFLTARSEELLRTLLEMQPRDSTATAATPLASREEKVKIILDEILDKVPEEFNMSEMMSRVEDKTPYVLVAFQELDRINALAYEIKRSLKELDLGLKGELTISIDMETLMSALFIDHVPATWSKLAYPSVLGLGAWMQDLVLRLRELEAWSADFTLPASVWLGGLFNPQSFLTAIMQSTARKNEWPLDKMCLHCDVTKKTREQILAAPREGASVHGLYMEGARWDMENGTISDSKIKELTSMMPVIFIKAVTQDKQETRVVYECPLYKTRQRGPTFVWTFNLKSKDKPAKWTLAGVALLLST